jgi:hypothetical protein
VELLVLEPSRVLLAWWLALHGLTGAALCLSAGVPGLAGLPILLLHGWLRRPVRERRLLVRGNSCCCLPLEGRFGLTLTTASQAGPGWVRLVFSDQPRKGLLVLRDQLDRAGWRRLNLALPQAN